MLPKTEELMIALEESASVMTPLEQRGVNPPSIDARRQPRCRFSGKPLKHTFVDLGASPIANNNLRAEDLTKPEKLYPLHVWVSEESLLVQLEEFQGATAEDIFNPDYVYFSSYSDSWLQHAKRYCEMMISRFGFGAQHHVIEVASNDGYLLRWFKERGVPALGIEPTIGTAEAARTNHGIDSINVFLGVETAKRIVAQGHMADLLVGNNVLAHVPDINDFISGLKLLLKPSGILTMEFPHLLQLMRHNEFDTIYHEHFSYLSFMAVQTMFEHHGLTLFDVEELPTHGGSLRIFARHTHTNEPRITDRVAAMVRQEIQFGLDRIETYERFAEQVKATKRKLLRCLSDLKDAGKHIVGYGSPAKGNTLLNYCGIGRDFIDYVVDRNPHKQGLFTPGTHIPILAPQNIFETRPD
ncbi:MAG TPA: class I SAM-dependent methyltransferase, partial [Candidatus Acidoferrum sp.]|nr:class I SAM-dependent methyltransferase [Candidatus Acidoferrum sp.]